MKCSSFILLYRDIKPGNILVHGDLVGGDFMVKLTDFGLATMTKVGFNSICDCISYFIFLLSLTFFAFVCHINYHDQK